MRGLRTWGPFSGASSMRQTNEPTRELRVVGAKGIVMLQKNKTAKKLSSRRGTVLLAIGVVAGLAAAPTGAQAGFLDQLFGAFQAPAPVQQQHTYYAGEGTMSAPMFNERRHVRRHVAAVSSKPVLQKTTSLMDDKTLRPGDAVMMKDGLHVYAGPKSSIHEPDQFVSLDDARHLSSKDRVKLAAMDGTRNDPLTNGGNPDTVASGRSAAVSAPIVEGYRITDAKGASVRYVGP